MFSRRVPEDLAANRLSQVLARLRADRIPILDLTESNPTRVGLRYVPETLETLATPAGLVYEPHPFGLPAAREAVADELARRGLTVGSERVVLTASTSEAYSLLFKLLCDPGDVALVPRPSYPLFEHLTRLDGVVTASYALEYDGRWAIDAAVVAQSMPPRTRALLIVNPNNPTGAYVTREELDHLAALCRDREVALIGDEVFADYPLEYEAPRAVSVLDQHEALTFALGGLSKSVGLPQLKLGWIVVGGPAAWVAQALSRLELICDTYLSVATPVQLATRALLAAGSAIRAQIAERIRSNYGVLLELAARHPACHLLRTEGGWSAVIRIPATRSEEAFVLELLEADRVLVHPGYFFDFDREAYVVVSLLPEPDLFRTGLERLFARVET